MSCLPYSPSLYTSSLSQHSAPSTRLQAQSFLLIDSLPVMESRGLTLRSKSRRPRPQISAPKPISGPLPTSNGSKGASTPGQNTSSPSSTSLDRAPSKGATSDLVKRRYSTRFNQVPDFDVSAPPVPGLPKAPATYGGLSPPETSRRPSTESSGPPKVDLNALRDPSLPVDKCE